MESYIAEAVRAYAAAEYRKLARRVVWHMRRLDASGTFGDDNGLKTLWDEYCFEIQQGPTPALEYAWASTVYPFLNDAVQKQPQHVLRLLSIYAAWELEDEEVGCSCWTEGVRELLEQHLRAEAMERTLRSGNS